MRISLEPSNGLQPVTNTNHAMTEITGSTITGFDEILTEVMAGSLEEKYSEAAAAIDTLTGDEAVSESAYHRSQRFAAADGVDGFVSFAG